MAKSEGKAVRVAIEGPDIEHDKLIGNIDKWNGEDRERASSAAETRGEIGQFTESSGMNAKALSMLRTIKKAAARDGGQAKAMDIIMSLKKGLPMVEADITGQQAQLCFEATEPDVVGDVADKGLEPTDALPAPSYSQDWNAEGDDSAGDPGLAADADDFEAHLAEVSGGAE